MNNSNATIITVSYNIKYSKCTTLFFLFVGVRIAQINPAEKRHEFGLLIIQGESHVFTQAVHELFFLEVNNCLPVGDWYYRPKYKRNTSVVVLQTNFST